VKFGILKGFVAANPQPIYHLLIHNINASMWMRSFWNNHIENERNGMNEMYMRQVRGQTYWMFHLKTNNLEIRFVKDTMIRPFVSIQSMHFVFPFCPFKVSNILIPISKQTWETEATLLSDFSSFLSLKVANWFFSTTKLPTLRDFFSIRFTLRNLILRPKSSLLDRGMAEFIFRNTSFMAGDDETCFCCKLNLIHNSTLGNIERF